MSTARLYSNNELIRGLQLQFPSAWHPIVLNAHYCAVTSAWVVTQFSGYMWNFETARGQITYRKRANQCEHFALRAALEVVDLFRQMPEGSVPPEAESLAVGCCAYNRADGRGWHEVNLWFIDQIWCPWEPQQRQFFNFTEAERLSVRDIIVP